MTTAATFLLAGNLQQFDIAYGFFLLPDQWPAVAGLVLLASPAVSQVMEPTPVPDHNPQLDSLYIAETQDLPGPDKVLHAEPLFLDLIRDLGAQGRAGMEHGRRVDRQSCL